MRDDRRRQRAPRILVSGTCVLLLDTSYFSDIPVNRGCVGYGASATGAGGLFRRRTG